jgi:predicted protein tyrosine phosphatase
MEAISHHIRTGKVLVHCGSGMSRSPVMVAIYMHLIGYKDFQEALGELKTLRPIVEPAEASIDGAEAYLSMLSQDGHG